MEKKSIVPSLIALVLLGLVSGIDVGPDTCGQDRAVLSNWFMSHGAPNLLLPPYPPLFGNVTDNPYDDPANPPQDPDTITGVCAIQWDNDQVNENGTRMYRMQNFDSELAAADAGFNVTHQGQCAACSSLQDLGVYMSQNLTEPTRLCGAMGSISEELEYDCMKALGFSDECVSIWIFNIHNTKKECFEVCLKSWADGEPNNKPDGSLNDCLQCDEDNSGPNFKYFSGRTRRNSGIPSAIHRPPQQFYNMTHCYWYGDLDEGSSSSNNQEVNPFQGLENQFLVFGDDW